MESHIRCTNGGGWRVEAKKERNLERHLTAEGCTPQTALSSSSVDNKKEKANTLEVV